MALARGGKTDTAFITPFEESGGRQSATWDEATSFYRRLADKYENLKIKDGGEIIVGSPMMAVYYNGRLGKGKSTGAYEESRLQPAIDISNMVVILINNGIHAGEPDGIDACMMLLRDAAMGKVNVPDNVFLAVIPVYNVSGALNRGCCSRANQNGPEAYGFRGNGQNLDLNRDFIKNDAVETWFLNGVFLAVQPDLFIDNHVSDGADYQHVITLLATQHDKLGGETGDYAYKTFTPMLYTDMRSKGYHMVPYVNDFDNTPENGWTEFLDLPRFSSGYAALYHTLAYVPETHMLKPYKDRVEATYQLMLTFIKTASEHADEIKKVRKHDFDADQKNTLFPLEWTVDKTISDSVLFSGYKSGYKPSGVSGLPRLYYDRTQPFQKNVPFYDHFVPSKSVKAPKAYIVPAGWYRLLALLNDNFVQLETISKDTSINVTEYVIQDYETVQKPYEGHYLHKNVKVMPHTITKSFRKGDRIIDLDQPAKRYLIETLEPEAPDAFFAWNFFDATQQQKEYYSDYVFEDIAAGLLKNDAVLRRQLDSARKADEKFAASAAAQLDFVYRHSAYMEPGFMKYPVYRIE